MLPSVILGNFNFLPNKMDDLATLKNQWIYHGCSLLMLTPTWLTNALLDAKVGLRGFIGDSGQRHGGMCEKKGWGTDHLHQQQPCFCEGGQLPY